MVDDRKPKIDLKARLGKTGVAQAPGSGSIPGPPMSVPAPPSSSIPAPSPGSIPAPPMGSAPPQAMGALAGMGQFRAPAQQVAAPPQPQRIEMDEGTIQEARSGAVKKGLVGGLIAGVMFGIVGYVAGGALEKSAGRQIAREDAHKLGEDVVKAKASLEVLLKKTEEARATLAKGEFPDAYKNELGGLTIDFNGMKLGGRRFSGFKVQTTQELIAFVTSVQEVNDNKDALLRMLTRLEKPMKEQAAAKDKTNIGYVVIVGTKDPSGNFAALLAPLESPLSVAKAKIDLPTEFSFIDPNSPNRAKAKLDRYKTGNLDKPSALYVSPGSVEKAFPSERSTVAGQLGVKLGELMTTIKGQGNSQQLDVVTETKPGLLERADALIKALGVAEKD